MSPRFLVTVPIPEPGLSLLRAAGEVTLSDVQPRPDELAAAVSSGAYDVLVSQLTDRLPGEVLGAAKLAGVANYAVGFDNIDIPAATAAGIMVGNTPGVLTDPTADIAFTLILAAARRAVEGDRMTRAGEFTGWRPDLLLGQDVTGATLGLIGTGRIAQATARRAAGFDMEVIHASARLPHDQAPSAVAAPELGTPVSLDELLTRADFVSLHVPLATETRHLIDAAAFAAMKPTAILINTARGPVVDEAALVVALREREIAAAGLDVYEAEPALAPGLADLPNVVLLPHLGSATIAVRAKMAELTARNAIAIGRGELPPHPVNPEAWGAR